MKVNGKALAKAGGPKINPMSTMDTPKAQKMNANNTGGNTNAQMIKGKC